MYRLFFDRIHVDASIGIHDFERAARQRLLVDVELFLTRDGDADHVESVPNYDDVREDVFRIAADRHFDLQETFCETACRSIFETGRYHAVIVSSRKPDVYKDVENVGCTSALTAADFDVTRALLLRGARV
jgi:dihydroneopterin aldolase